MPKYVRRHLVFRHANHYRRDKILDRVFFGALGGLIIVAIYELGGLL